MPNDTADMPIPKRLGICPDCGYYPLDELYNLQAENRALQLKLDEMRWRRLPDEQAWWWHWDGEDYSIPHIYSVLVSNTGKDRYFIQYPDSRWCDEVGGFWRKVGYPNVSSRSEQAALINPPADQPKEKP